VTLYQKAMMKIGNVIKAFGQQLQQKQQADAEASQGGGLKPEDKAALAMKVATERAKLTFGKQKHAAQTAQKQITFEQKLHQQADEHKLKVVHSALDAAAKAKKQSFNGESED